MGTLRLKNPTVKEHQIEHQILTYLNLVKKIEAKKVPSAGYFDAKRKVFRRHTSPYACRGFPDIFFLYHGVFVGLEVKSKTGKQSPDQLAFETFVKSHHGFYFLVRSIADVEEALRQIEVQLDPTLS